MDTLTLSAVHIYARFGIKDRPRPSCKCVVVSYYVTPSPRFVNTLTHYDKQLLSANSSFQLSPTRVVALKCYQETQKMICIFSLNSSLRLHLEDVSPLTLLKGVDTYSETNSVPVKIVFKLNVSAFLLLTELPRHDQHCFQTTGNKSA